MTGQTYTQAYLLGIREGRETLQRFVVDGIADPATMRAHLANCSAKGLSGEMAEFTRGERDFFRNQLAKLESAQ
jgi:hypothetical protein